MLQIVILAAICIGVRLLPFLSRHACALLCLMSLSIAADAADDQGGWQDIFSASGMDFVHRIGGLGDENDGLTHQDILERLHGDDRKTSYRAIQYAILFTPDFFVNRAFTTLLEEDGMVYEAARGMVADLGEGNTKALFLRFSRQGQTAPHLAFLGAVIGEAGVHSDVVEEEWYLAKCTDEKLTSGVYLLSFLAATRGDLDRDFLNVMTDFLGHWMRAVLTSSDKRFVLMEEDGRRHLATCLEMLLAKVMPETSLRDSLFTRLKEEPWSTNRYYVMSPAYVLSVTDYERNESEVHPLFQQALGAIGLSEFPQRLMRAYQTLNILHNYSGPMREQFLAHVYEEALAVQAVLAPLIAEERQRAALRLLPQDVKLLESAVGW